MYVVYYRLCAINKKRLVLRACISIAVARCKMWLVDVADEVAAELVEPVHRTVEVRLGRVQRGRVLVDGVVEVLEPLHQEHPVHNKPLRQPPLRLGVGQPHCRPLSKAHVERKSVVVGIRLQRLVKRLPRHHAAQWRLVHLELRCHQQPHLLERVDVRELRLHLVLQRRDVESLALRFDGGDRLLERKRRVECVVLAFRWSARLDQELAQDVLGRYRFALRGYSLKIGLAAQMVLDLVVRRSRRGERVAHWLRIVFHDGRGAFIYDKRIYSKAANFGCNFFRSILTIYTQF